MAGAGRRRPKPDRLAWIRAPYLAEAARRKAERQQQRKRWEPRARCQAGGPRRRCGLQACPKAGGGGGNETCSPKLGSGGHDVSRKRAVEVGDGGDDGSYGPNMGTRDYDGSLKHVMEVGLAAAAA